jgi:hypothetical protein
MFAIGKRRRGPPQHRVLETLLLVSTSFLSLSPCFGEDDFESSVTSSFADQNVLPDAEANARLKKALNGTAPELLEMVPLSGGTYTMGSPFDLGSVPEGWFIAMVFGARGLVNQGPQHGGHG